MLLGGWSYVAGVAWMFKGADTCLAASGGLGFRGDGGAERIVKAPGFGNCVLYA